MHKCISFFLIIIFVLFHNDALYEIGLYMKGMSLIEVLVAMLIFSIMMLGVGTILLQSLKLTRMALNKSQELIQEEVIRCAK